MSSTYQQWRNGVDKGRCDRALWVCGPERTLVEEIVATVRATAASSPEHRWTLIAGETSDTLMWDHLHQIPLDPQARRVVVVRQAERVCYWGPLGVWLANQRGAHVTTVVFVGNDDDVPTLRQRGKPAGPAPQIEAIRRSGRVVRCTMPNETDLLAWVGRQIPVSEEVAAYLLGRADGDLREIRNVAAKLAVFPEVTIGRQVIDQLIQPSPRGVLADLIIRGERGRALRAAQALDRSALIGTVELIYRRLDVLARLRGAESVRVPARASAGVPGWLAQRYMDVARFYDHQRRAYARRLLADCDAVLRRGVRHGVAELLIASW